VIAPELAEDFRDKRVLVTGGLGFIGSTLARELVECGAEVLLIDSLIPEYGGNRENVADIEDRLEVHVSDVRDQHSLRQHVLGRDVIFNLAGQTSHLDSMVDPYTDLEINCRAQLSILEVCRHHNPAAKVVFASTRQLYGRPRYLPVDEEHPVAPVDVNGINKAAGEHYHLVYGEVYGIPVAVLRLTNTYGPRMRVRDARQTFLGDWIRRVVLGEQILVWGDGEQRRDFNYVDDAVRAFLLAAARDEANGRIYNLGDRRHVSLREVAALLADRYGATFRFEPFPDDRKVIDIGDYYSDYARIRDALGWEPRVSLEEGLDRTVAFFRERGAGTYWERAA
jgi:UDP-glucose 4-epimerase